MYDASTLLHWLLHSRELPHQRSRHSGAGPVLFATVEKFAFFVFPIYDLACHSGIAFHTLLGVSHAQHNTASDSLIASLTGN